MIRDGTLYHYGVGHKNGGHSGRYPWGSGKRPRMIRGTAHKIVENLSTPIKANATKIADTAKPAVIGAAKVASSGAKALATAGKKVYESRFGNAAREKLGTKIYVKDIAKAGEKAYRSGKKYYMIHHRGFKPKHMTDEELDYMLSRRKKEDDLLRLSGKTTYAEKHKRRANINDTVWKEIASPIVAGKLLRMYANHKRNQLDKDSARTSEEFDLIPGAKESALENHALLLGKSSHDYEDVLRAVRLELDNYSGDKPNVSSALSSLVGTKTSTRIANIVREYGLNDTAKDKIARLIGEGTDEYKEYEEYLSGKKKRYSSDDLDELFRYFKNPSQKKKEN